MRRDYNGSADLCSSIPSTALKSPFQSEDVQKRQDRVCAHQHDTTSDWPSVPLRSQILPGALNIYTKGLQHYTDGAEQGLAVPSTVDAVLKCTNWTDLCNLPLGGVRKQASPGSAWSMNMLGAPNGSVRAPPPHKWNSDALARDFVELQGMALVRNVPFSQYETDGTIAEVVSALNDAGIVCTSSTVFRMFAGEGGFYVSQLLYRDVSNGFSSFPPKYTHFPESQQYLTTVSDYLAVHNGAARPPAQQVGPQRYILNLSDLAALVEKDDPGSFYVCAYNQLVKMGVPTFAANPNNGTTAASFVDFGITDVQALVGYCSLVALVNTWGLKWRYWQPRPEEYGYLAERQRTGDTPSVLPVWMFENPIMVKVLQQQGNVLLSQLYSVGSPNHPSYPAGHAVIAGACCTLLKAYFDMSFLVDELVPNHDGSELIATGRKVPIVSEINKLASNVAMGRNAAGVHYRNDAALNFGEMIALQLLRDHAAHYCQATRFTVPTFDGRIEFVEVDGRP